MTVRCRTCGQLRPVDCTDEQYVRWKEGRELIQDVMPKTSKDQRELLLSGICGECFEKMFLGGNKDE